MTRYVKRPVIVEATQWFKNGDHPLDESRILFAPGEGEFLSEGNIVRFYRHPYVSANLTCTYCEQKFHDHGWIDTFEGGHIVCPGDWIITGVKGEHYPCKPNIFSETYTPEEIIPSYPSITLNVPRELTASEAAEIVRRFTAKVDIAPIVIPAKGREFIEVDEHLLDTEPKRDGWILVVAGVVIAVAVVATVLSAWAMVGK